jgi:hypothetical protein
LDIHRRERMSKSNIHYRDSIVSKRVVIITTSILTSILLLVSAACLWPLCARLIRILSNICPYISTQGDHPRTSRSPSRDIIYLHT